MGKQMTEMLKGTLEGIVLAILAGRPAYGYEITAWLRERASPTSPRAPSTPCWSASSNAAWSTWTRCRRRRGRHARCTP
ncbi:PadR family transcriptional regulator [Nonomuraea rubra]|uniref:PadR family transcriptional regulator n=1 Tax=Nonomuraea rubra TaxID=46180 RepID=UPI003610BA08